MDATLMWLRTLAEDVIEHDCCSGCKVNAAQALEEHGLLAEVLARLGVDDPRKTVE